jgi:hypothetical protein
MKGSARKPLADITLIIGRLIGRLRRALVQLVSCSYPGDPAMIEIMLKPDGDLWQDRHGKNHVAGRPCQSLQGND